MVWNIFEQYSALNTDDCTFLLEQQLYAFYLLILLELDGMMKCAHQHQIWENVGTIP